MKRIIFILAFLPLVFNLYSQIDTEFWFACPDLSSDHSDGSIRLTIFTYDQPATVTIEQPAGGGFPKQVKKMEPNSSWELPLGGYLTYIETTYGAVRNTGLHVTSTAPISAYYANYGDNSEIYALKGGNALGTKFIVPMQYEYNNSSSSWTGWASVEFVAVEDGTVVKFTPTKKCEGHLAGVEATINLNKGQSYAIRSSSRDAEAGHFYNTPITSNKPIAVNYTDDSVAGPGVDLLGDQLVPVNLLGMEYIAVKNTGFGADERLYIFPTEDNTDVYINGVKATTLSLSGTTSKFSYKFASSEAAVHIRATKPITVLQITGKNNGSSPELGATILPNIECSGSTEVAYKPLQRQAPHVSIVTRKENIGQFTNPYLAFPQIFQPVPGTNDEWYYAIRSISTDSKGMIRVNSTNGGVFHMGVFDSPGSTCSFGYFSDYSPHPIGTTTNKSHYIVGDVVELSVPNPEALTSVSYTDPFGNVHTVNNPTTNPIFTIQNTDKSYAGKYIVTGSSKYGCKISEEVIMISIFEDPVATDVYSCLGDEVVLTAKGNGPYKWIPSGISNEKTAVITPREGDTTYVYQVENYKPGANIVYNSDFNSGFDGFITDYENKGASGSIANPGSCVVGTNPMLYNPAFINKNDHTYGDILPALSKQLIINCTAGESLLWEQSVEGLVLGQANKFTAWLLNANLNANPVKVKYKVNGLFAVERDNDGTIILDGNGNETEIAAFEVPADGQWHELSYVWRDSVTKATLSILAVETNAGSAISLDDIGLSPLYNITDTFHVHVRDSLAPALIGKPYICGGRSELSVEDIYDTYYWSNGQTSYNAVFTEPGDYSLRVTEGDCGRGTIFFTITPSPPVSITLNDMPEICSGQSEFAIPFTLDEGVIGNYTILFDEKAKSAGFVDIIEQPVNNLNIDVLLPENVWADNYTAELKVFQAGCSTEGTISPSSTLEFTVNYNPAQVITQRWNDVLGVTNSKYNNNGKPGYEFSGYQWYKNGTELSGETKSYLYEPNRFNDGDCYSVLLSRADGTSILSCEFCPVIYAEELLSPKLPSLVESSQTITLEQIKASSGYVCFWSLTGRLESKQPISKEQPQVKAPSQAGVYVLEIVTGDERSRHKIIVKE